MFFTPFCLFPLHVFSLSLFISIHCLSFIVFHFGLVDVRKGKPSWAIHLRRAKKESPF
jgi:uncharacterized membrane protein YobD (UPF0266 family)